MVVVFVASIDATKKTKEKKIKKKDITDWDDGDVEKIFEEWEVCRNEVKIVDCFSTILLL